ncbi:MAG: RNase adapter RapZ [Deltaproteobacteria bacterium]|nr:MAG: RNase adapter RapZ [Deltaproteobacteria bacterium]
MKNLPIIVITGLSGSGKSTAIDAFEDAGFYCVDNMPVALLPKFLELPAENVTDINGLAFVMDLRERSFIGHYPDVFQEIRRKGYRFTLLFLEAQESVLIRRYKETRRTHPIGQSVSIIDGVREEQRLLAPLKAAADTRIDSSEYTAHKLKAVIFSLAQKYIPTRRMRIQVISFGFKFGVPVDLDLLMDVRFLPNPYFISDIRHLDGETEPIRDFVLSQEATQTFLSKYIDLLDFLVPYYQKEGKSYLTIGIGCTGGRHRSVVLSRYIGDAVRKHGIPVTVTHRDISQH